MAKAKKISAKQQLLTGASGLAMAALAVTLSANPALAADQVVGSTLSNTNFKVTATGDKTAVVSSGDINDSGHAAVGLNGKSAGLISVDTHNANTGIRGTSGEVAIDGSTVGSVLNNLTINSGTVTSDASTGTIVLGGTASSPNIDVEGGSLTNTGTGSVFTTSGGNTRNTALTLTNKTTVTSTSGSPTINIIDTDGGSSVSVSNDGTLGATGGSAIHLGNGGSGANSATITSNTGTINGKIDGGTSGTNTVTITSNTGTINGAVDTFGGALSVTQGMGGSIVGDITTNSGALSLTNNSNSTITGGVNFGSATTSFATLNGSSSITGNILMGNANQTLTLNSSALDAIVGTIDGPGLLVISANSQSDGVIGGTTPLTNITVNSTKTFTLNNNASATTTTLAGNMTINDGDLLTSNVTVDSGALLKVGTTAVAGTINGDANHDGSLEITGTETSNGAIGGNFSLSNITVDSGKTFTLNNNATADTTTLTGNMTINDGKTLTSAVTIDSGSLLKVGTTAVAGTINGDANHDGSLEITGTETSNGAIGGNFSLSNITVDSGKTFTLNNNATADTTTLTGNMTINDGKTLTSAVTIDSGSLLKVGTTAVAGTIDGDANHDGSLEIIGTETSNGIIGGNFSLSNITVDSTKTFTLDNNATADTTSLAGNMTINDGKLLTSAVTVDGDATLKVGNTAVAGTIDGDTNDDGLLEITGTETSNGAIGSNFSLANITVDSAATFTLANNATADTTTVAGTMAISDGDLLTSAVTINDGGLLKVGTTGVAGTIDGDIDHHGSLEITGTETSNGDIGGNFSLSNITVDSAATFTLANNATADTTTVAGTMAISDGDLLTSTVTINNNGLLKVGTTAVAGTIDGDANHHGSLEITGTETSNGVIGGNFSLSNITVDSAATFTLANNATSDTTTVAGTMIVGDTDTLTSAVTIDNGGLLKVGTIAVAGTIDGDVAGDGNLEITNSETSNGVIGGNFALNNIKVDNGKTFTLGGNAAAATVTVGTGSTLIVGDNHQLDDNGFPTAVTLDSGALLTAGNTAVIGSIDGDANHHGSLEITGTETSNGAIGSNFSLSNITVDSAATFTLANNATADTTTLVGNLTVGDGQTLTSAVTIDSGSLLKVGTTGVAGTIDGDANHHGSLEITGTETSNGAIGGNFSLSNIKVDSAATFTLANNATADTTTVAGTMAISDGDLLTSAVTINNNGLLKVGTTAVAGTIDGDANHHGSLEITGTETSNGVIGGNFSLSNITVDASKTFTLANNATADTTTLNGDMTIGDAVTLTSNVSIGEDATLKVGSDHVVGTIDGTANHTGILHITNSETSDGVIGGNFSLSNIAVDSNKTFTLANNASADNFTLASDSTLALGNVTATGAALLGNSALISFNDVNSVFSGTIDGNGGTHGQVVYSAPGTFATGGDIGHTNAVWSVTVDDNANLEIANNVNARSITIGTSTDGAAATQDSDTTVTTTHGLLLGANSSYTLNGGALASTVALGTGSILNITGEGSTVSGAIDGASGPDGFVEVDADFTNSAAIGSTNGIGALSINDGATLTLGANVKATTTVVSAGTSLDFGSSAHTIVGDLTSVGTGDINLEGNHNTLTGNLVTGTTGTIDVKLNNDVVPNTSNSAGQLAISGTANIGAGTHLVIDTSAIAAYNPGSAGIDYTIATSSGLTEGLDISGIDPNIFTHATDVSTADNLVIHLAHLSLGTFADNSNEAAVGAALDTVPLPASGNLASFLTTLYAAPDAATAKGLLNQALPQVDNGAPTATFDDANIVANTVQLRMASLRDGSNETGMAAGDGAVSNNVWMQGFGERGDQDNSNGVYGYKANTGGAAVGIDHSLDSINGYGGFSISYANSSIDSNDDLKKTTVDSYQANLYGTKKFDSSWYVDGLLGAAYNQFDTSRTILSPAVRAEGNFNGETYLARLGAGRDFALGGNGWSLTPGATLTYAYSTFQSYTETGAGTMDLNVSQDNTQELQSRIGSGIGYSYTTSGGTTIRPAVHAAWLYDIVNDGQADTSTFTGGGASFATKGLTPDKNGFNLGADINIYDIKGVSVLANYDYEKRSDYTSNSGSLRLRYNY